MPIFRCWVGARGFGERKPRSSPPSLLPRCRSFHNFISFRHRQKTHQLGLAFVIFIALNKDIFARSTERLRIASFLYEPHTSIAVSVDLAFNSKKRGQGGAYSRVCDRLRWAVNTIFLVEVTSHDAGFPNSASWRTALPVVPKQNPWFFFLLIAISGRVLLNFFFFLAEMVKRNFRRACSRKERGFELGNLASHLDSPWPHATSTKVILKQLRSNCFDPRYCSIKIHRMQQRCGLSD